MKAMGFIMGVMLGGVLAFLTISVYYHSYQRCDCSGWENHYIECNTNLYECVGAAWECVDCGNELQDRMGIILDANRFYYESWIEFGAKYEACQYTIKSKE